MSAFKLKGGQISSVTADGIIVAVFRGEHGSGSADQVKHQSFKIKYYCQGVPARLRLPDTANISVIVELQAGYRVLKHGKQLQSLDIYICWYLRQTL